MSRPPSEPRPRRSDRPRAGGQGSTGAPEQNWRWAVIVLLGLVVAVLLLPPLFSHTPRKQLTYTDLSGRPRAGHARSAVGDSPNGHITGELADGTKYRVSGPQPPIADDLKSMRAHKVDLTFHSPQSNIFGSLLAYAFPILLVIAFFVWMNRRAQGQMSGIMSIGRSKAKVYTTERPRTTFNDVAGYSGVKQEIREVVEFLRSPGRFKEIGARIPKGVLLVGPPGTGKTLLARAVAGEAGVPFLSVTGSDFMEMFVGMGASRVRDLFQTARKQAPAIIFVDEIDSIGRKRGAGLGGGHDEREQTLNQMLAEMDGFESTEGIVMMAATNRPDILDPALLRPGRFDRQIVVPLPDLEERLPILKVHCKDKKLSHDVDLDVVARGTPGMSGADLANLVNEAAMFAVLRGADKVAAREFEDARHRLLKERRRGTIALSDV